MYRVLPLFLLSGLARASSGGGHGDGGIPWADIVSHAVNLTLLLGVLIFLTRGKIKAALAERSASTKRDIDEANALRKEAQERFDELQTEIDGFEKKLEEMRSQAEERAEQDAAALMARADQDAERIRETAQRSIRDETTRARAALRREAAVLGVELAEKKVSSEFAEEDEARLAGEFLGKVSNGGGHG
ncbi:MAG: ATP synthase F0 subunit B [Myxococcota bacterium]|jgi:F-type H+-transporting ATPase subunit b|nr:ATP synthase F0 subunit B [Myxococcota bacterium]